MNDPTYFARAPGKPKCRYGDRCCRLNPQHWQDFDHDDTHPLLQPATVPSAARPAPAMVGPRRKQCSCCSRIFWLDGWQADSDRCNGCGGSRAAAGVDMPEAFVHRQHRRYTSVVSASIGRRNGEV